MSKLTFSSDDLPAHLGDQARFSTWYDLYVDSSCQFDITRLPDLPFSMRFELLNVGELSVLHSNGTPSRYIRSARQVANDPFEAFFLAFNGPRPWRMDRRGTSHDYAADSVALLATTEPTDRAHAGGVNWRGVVIQSRRLRQLVKQPDDLAGCTFDPQSEIARHLRRYVEMLLSGGELGQDPALLSQVETALADLIVLLLDGRRDAVELATLRGLRAARLQEILAHIKASYADPGFSPGALAARLELSANYVQKLLYETDTTFTERVLELRLQKARAMLADRGNDCLKISDVALDCGFNEVSYFNRCFRGRFGATPTQFRGRD
jgi:AraC-like DNA-binding protein